MTLKHHPTAVFLVHMILHSKCHKMPHTKIPLALTNPYLTYSTVYENVLEEHMKSRCNARPRAPEQYHSLNINCSLPLSTEELEFQKTIYSHKNMHPQPWLVRVQLSELAKEDLDTIIDKTQKTYRQELPFPIKTVVLKNDSAESKR